MKRWFKCTLLLSFIFLGISLLAGQAQAQPDSLKEAVPSEQQTEPETPDKKKKFQIRIPKIHLEKQRDSLVKVGDRLFEKARGFIEGIDAPPVKDIIRPNREISPSDQVALDSAMKAMDEALQYLELEGDAVKINTIKETMGAVHQASGSNKVALDTYLEVLDAAELSGDKERIANAKFNVGNIYSEEGNYRKARQYYEEALVLYRELSRVSRNRAVEEKLPLLYVNLGKCYQNMGQTEKALEYYNRALAASEKIGNKDDGAYAFNNIGALYKDRKDWRKAIEFHEKALAGYDSIGNEYAKAGEYNNMGGIFMEQGDLGRADALFRKSLQVAQAVKSREQEKEAYLQLSKNAEKKGQLNEALDYYQRYQQLKDSLAIEEKKRQMALLESRYDAERKEAQIQRLEKDNALSELNARRQRAIRNYALAGAGFMLLLAFAYWQRSRYRRQKEKSALEEQRIAHLEKLDQLKDDFLANTSHELRTPLNGIIGLAESLSDGVVGSLPKEAVYNLNMIAASGRRLSSLVNDILDFSRIKKNDLPLQLSPADLYAATDVVLALSGPLAKGKGLKLYNQVPKRIPLVEADENRLQQILHNLVGNAIKFTEDGSVRVTAEEQEGCVAITVSDTGIGISAEKHEAIFHAFEQADGSVVREYGGTGLGLTVTKQLVELHRGTISLRSEPGKGSHFTFTLPLSQDQQRQAPDLGEIAGRGAPVGRLHDSGWDEALTLGAVAEQPLMKSVAVAEEITRVLIVDDEPVNLKVLENHLRLQGYEVETAGSGPQALEILQRAQPFDLIILDIMMPKMSGYEVCRKIRQSYPASNLPIVLLTAKNRVADLVEGFHAGANDYIAKPFSRDELLSRIQTHLNLNRIHKASGKFVPFEFLRSIGRESITDVRLGDQAEKLVTVMFSDIRNYTTLSETMSPSDNFQFVKSLNGRMGPIIQAQQGFVNQYLGDAIMAIFPDQPADALQAAIGMQANLRLYNTERLQKGRKPIQIGIGMQTGPLIMGVIGDDHRMDAATISDTVNTASRVESLTKYYGASILLTQDSLARIGKPEAFNLRYLGQVQVKGKNEPVGLLECFDGDEPEQAEKKLATLELFQQGLDFYLGKDFSGALNAFQQVLQQNPGDHIARHFQARAVHYMNEPAPEDWTGVEMMKGK
ncbi:MAG: tetratricopeptide repeat protein [Lewinellaceae bacterium]|nr:tetratricopeptide repeat protein [Phaeodactylibacter sp.]MCB9346528.1 tetratricopeptide repeat protein [Lewinellaceae bacterium]